ncbi:ABC transporter transmembrane region 2-domain-containing protein [Flammula alnicola]|nr:ABC transporter transmembrane region 2-domain-containing protein [Flammula alnicola]
MAIFSKPIFPSHPLPLPPRLTQRPVVLAFLILVLLRSRTFTLPKDVIQSLRQKVQHLTTLKLKRKLTKDELAKVLQQVYIDEADGSHTLLVPYRERMIKVPIHPTPKSQFVADKPHFPLLPPQAVQKPNIDAAFLSQLRAILFRVAIPSWYAPEAGIVVLHSTFLVLRTVLSILVARLDGRIVRDLVKADGKGFLKGLGLWFLLAIPSTFTNSMIRHLQSLLALRLRTRLTRYLHDLYLSSNPDLRYYHASNYLDGVDQYLTADVDAWSNALSGLYGNILKPSLDLLLFTSQLSRSLGVRGTILLFMNYYATVAILRAVTPAFGRLAAVEARLEGEYRAGMGRVGREAEEVAFYDGGARERDILTNAYMKLIKHVNSIYKIRIAYEWTEDYVIKYLWSAAGYALIAVPILYTRTKRSLGIQTGHPSKSERDRTDDAVAGRTETYISNRRLLLSLADAGGRLMYAYKDLLELAGLTTRLYTLFSTLLNMPPGYMPIRVEQAAALGLRGIDVRIPRLVKGKDSSAEAESMEGSLVNKEREDPPLVKDLNLVIKRGEHIMITGSNGVGKTAVARVLAGLWDPVATRDGEGSVEMPRDETEADVMLRQSLGDGHSRPRPTLYVVPQRSYMPTGSLLEQIIYPCSYASFVRMTASASSSSSPPTSFLKRSASMLSLSGAQSSYTPAMEPSEAAIAEIHEILEKVHLGYLVAREGGLHIRKEWRDVLSGGEKQRMAIARVLWWRPKFAVLDECTSAVSSDVEGRMYEAAKALDITLITISLRPFLMKYHNQLLTLHGPAGTSPGKWTLSRIGTPEERMSLNREIGVIEEKLKEVAGWEKRVKELEELLGVQEGVDEQTKEEQEADREEEEELAILERERRDEESSASDLVDSDEESEDGQQSVSLMSASDAEAEAERQSLSVTEDGIVVEGSDEGGVSEAMEEEEFELGSEEILAEDER